MRKTATGVAKQAGFSAGGAIVGGVLAGPIGAMVGGMVGSGIGFLNSDKYPVSANFITFSNLSSDSEHLRWTEGEIEQRREGWIC